MCQALSQVLELLKGGPRYLQSSCSMRERAARCCGEDMLSAREKFRDAKPRETGSRGMLAVRETGGGWA